MVALAAPPNNTCDVRAVAAQQVQPTPASPHSPYFNNSSKRTSTSKLSPISIPSATIFPTQHPHAKSSTHRRATSQPLSLSSSSLLHLCADAPLLQLPGFSRASYAAPSSTTSILARPRPIPRRVPELLPVTPRRDKPLPATPQSSSGTAASLRNHKDLPTPLPATPMSSTPPPTPTLTPTEGALAKTTRRRIALEVEIRSLKTSLGPTVSPDPSSFAPAPLFSSSKSHGSKKSQADAAELAFLEQQLADVKSREHELGIAIWRKWRRRPGGEEGGVANGVLWVRSVEGRGSG